MAEGARDYVRALLKPWLFVFFEGCDEIAAVWAVADLVADILSRQDGAAVRATFFSIFLWRKGTRAGL